VKTVATEAQGVQELAAVIAEYEDYLSKQGQLLQRRKLNWETRLVEMLRDTLLEKARAAMSQDDLSRWAGEVTEGKRDPYSVIEEVAGRVTR